MAAMLVDIAIVRVLRGVWFFPSGALLSGLIVALILSPAEPWYVPAITAALAVGSKYLLRTKQGHIFNPAALALVAAYFLFASGQDWWGALANVPAPFLIVLLATGLFVADRVNKLPMVLIFTGCYFLLFAAFAYAGDPARVAEIFRVPDVNATLFFALFMLTDPPTSPARYRDQVVFGSDRCARQFRRLFDARRRVLPARGSARRQRVGDVAPDDGSIRATTAAAARSGELPAYDGSRPVAAAAPRIGNETGNNRRA